MAIRPIYISKKNSVGVTQKDIDFEWFPGFAKIQKQKSFNALHNEANKKGIKNILEISSASDIELGFNLSAFNLVITTKKYKNKFTVETAFQGSKVFEKGGPYIDLFGMDSRAAKKDQRLRTSGLLVKFQFFNQDFPLEPKTFFYDWLYMNALHQNKKYVEEIVNYDAFTDIEFNPKRSINCQAHSAALYVSLMKNDLTEKALSSPQKYLDVLKDHYSSQEGNIMIQESII